MEIISLLIYDWEGTPTTPKYKPGEAASNCVGLWAAVVHVLSDSLVVLSVEVHSVVSRDRVLRIGSDFWSETMYQSPREWSIYPPQC